MGFGDAIKPGLLSQAPVVAVRQDKKLDMYISMAHTYREQGREFVAQGDLERAYICLMRFSNVVTATIPQHKHYALDKYKRERTMLKNQLINTLEILEQITAKLEKKYAVAKDIEEITVPNDVEELEEKKSEC
jgi:hypothetical protein